MWTFSKAGAALGLLDPAGTAGPCSPRAAACSLAPRERLHPGSPAPPGETSTSRVAHGGDTVGLNSLSGCGPPNSRQWTGGGHGLPVQSRGHRAQQVTWARHLSNF